MVGDAVLKSFRKASGGLMHVNDTLDHLSKRKGGRLPQQVTRACRELRSYSSSRPYIPATLTVPPLETEVLVHVEALRRSKPGYCLSPGIFTSLDTNRLTWSVADGIVSAFPLGRSLRKQLGSVGLFEFIKRGEHKETRRRLARHLDIFLASLCLSTDGAATAKQITSEAFLTWLFFFRTPDRLRWREDLWGRGYPQAFQCLRELTLAFARLSGDKEVAKYARNTRVSTNRATTWSILRENASGSDAAWLALFDEWRSGVRVTKGDSKKMIRAVMHWAKDIMPERTIADIMLSKDRGIHFADHFALNCKESPKQYLSCIRLAQRFSVFIESELRSQGFEDALWPLVEQRDVDRAARASKAGGSNGRLGEARSNPLPPPLQSILEEILAEGENGWPGQYSLFRETTIDDKGKVRSIYCPVLPTFFQAMLLLPTRGAQMCRLDSGEGDRRAFDGHELSWNENRGPLAGYWEKHESRAAEHGYARLAGEHGSEVTGFFINTNKTGEPWIIPWENPRLHRLLWELRLWQEKYNPISAPIPPEAYIEAKDPEEKEEARERFGDIFPLFRLPGNGGYAAPPNYRKRSQAWNDLMVEVQRRWNERNPKNQISIVKFQKKTGQSYGSIYGMHGLRVAGLTRLFMAGVPIEILSKLVAGHRGLLMTIYYLKFQPAHVHDILETAAENASEQAEQFIDDLKNWSFEQAKTRAAYLEEDGIVAATEMNPALKMMATKTDIGLCPWGGTRCWDGGPLRKNFTKSNGTRQPIHDPVEGGEKNCIMCRHLISGPAWLTPLWLFGTSLLERFTQIFDRLEDLDAQRDELVDRRNKASSEQERIALQRKEQVLDLQRDGIIGALELILRSIYRVHRLVEMSEAIRKAGNGETVSQGSDLIAMDSASITEFMEATEFERSAIVTASSRVYSIMRNPETEARRDAFLDKMMYMNGSVPISMTPLTRDQKRFAQDSLARMVMERLERAETQALADGRLTLEDVGLAMDVNHLMGEQLHQALTLGPGSL